MLINRKAVKAYALGLAHELRAQPFSRVSSAFAGRAEAHLREWIERQIKGLPSKGKTIK